MQKAALLRFEGQTFGVGNQCILEKKQMFVPILGCTILVTGSFDHEIVALFGAVIATLRCCMYKPNMCPL